MRNSRSFPTHLVYLVCAPALSTQQGRLVVTADAQLRTASTAARSLPFLLMQLRLNRGNRRVSDRVRCVVFVAIIAYLLRMFAITASPSLFFAPHFKTSRCRQLC